MRVLVLGGTGLISTAITRELLARGDDVTTLNRGLTPGADPRVRQVTGDRHDIAALRAAWGEGQDVVVDMICFAPADADLVIEAYGGLGAQYVFCSTVDVYTKPARTLPVREDHERLPSAAFSYAYNKARCEDRLLEAHAGGVMPVTILRPAATYLDAAVPSVGSFDLALERLEAGLPLVLHGDGTSLWVACHRDDVARSFVAAAGNPVTYGQAYNVTGLEPMTFRAYWEAVADAIGIPPSFVFVPSAALAALAPRLAEWCVQNFMYHNMFDCSAAIRDLGFAFTVDWPTGIREGLVGRRRRTVDHAEREAYELLVSTWLAATGDAVRSLGPKGL